AYAARRTVTSRGRCFMSRVPRFPTRNPFVSRLYASTAEVTRPTKALRSTTILSMSGASVEGPRKRHRLYKKVPSLISPIRLSLMQTVSPRRHGLRGRKGKLRRGGYAPRGEGRFFGRKSAARR